MEVKSNTFFIAKSISSKIGKILPASMKKYIKERMINKSIEKYINIDKVPYKKGMYKEGINLIGGIRAEMGLGQSCRLIANMIKEANYRFSIYNYGFSGMVKEGDDTFDEFISDELPYAINIFHVNPCELGNLYMGLQDAWKGRYNIAFWLWELEEFPREWEVYCKLFDEIWTPSEFAGRAIKKITDVPVKVLPYYVTAPYKKTIGRKEFLLPGSKFLFLIMYDINSTEGRKNPQGAVRAFKEAFAPQNNEVGLVIKVNNGTDKQIEKLKNQLSEYKNIYYITETVDKEAVNSLIKCCDVFVSLHRAEGFGLVMAEAMILGRPVVATNWSSNTEFMNKDVACMVDYQMIKNPRTEGLYEKGCMWAEPDYKQAAEYMERLWQDQEFYFGKQKKGEVYIDNVLNRDKLIGVLKKYIGEIIN